MKMHILREKSTKNINLNATIFYPWLKVDKVVVDFVVLVVFFVVVISVVSQSTLAAQSQLPEA
jgi:hypothetical protein